MLEIPAFSRHTRANETSLSAPSPDSQQTNTSSLNSTVSKARSARDRRRTDVGQQRTIEVRNDDIQRQDRLAASILVGELSTGFSAGRFPVAPQPSKSLHFSAAKNGRVLPCCQDQPFRSRSRDTDASLPKRLASRRTSSRSREAPAISCPRWTTRGSTFYPASGCQKSWPNRSHPSFNSSPWLPAISTKSTGDPRRRFS